MELFGNRCAGFYKVVLAASGATAARFVTATARFVAVSVFYGRAIGIVLNTKESNGRAVAKIEFIGLTPWRSV